MKLRQQGLIFRLFNYSPKDRRAITTGILFSLVAVVTSTLCPKILTDIVDEIGDMIGRGDLHITDSLVLSMCLLQALCAATFALITVKNWLISHASVRLADRLRKDLFDKTRRIPYSFFVHSRIGDVSSRITSDCKVIAYYSGSCISTIISSVFMALGVGVMMFVINPELAAVSIFPIESGVLLVLFFSKSIKRFFFARQRMLGAANSSIMDCIYGHTSIKLFGAEEQTLEGFEEVNDGLTDNLEKSYRYSSIIPSIMDLITNISYVILCGYGALMVLDGKATFGVIVGFLVYMKLFTSPVTEFASSLSTFNQVNAATSRVFDILDAKEMDASDNVAPSDVRGDVEFDNVTFSYDGDRNIIDGVSLNVRQGQKIAIVGLSGSGKTTLMNLLMGFFEIGSGDIRIDGHSVKNMDQYTVHDMFSLVNQDNWVFTGTYRDNIVYNSPARPDEDIYAICDSVGLAHVRDLPEGLDTRIPNPGALSAGQKQQITIARAMMRDAPILILDEATSSVDIKTEKAIIHSLDTLVESKTSFVIAHRLSTVRNADLIVVLENGKVVESGTEDELMALKGRYHRLLTMQSPSDAPAGARAPPC